MKRRRFISSLFAAVAAIALPKLPEPKPKWNRKLRGETHDGPWTWANLGPATRVDYHAIAEAIKETDRIRFQNVLNSSTAPYLKAGEGALQRLHSNTYPRPAADLRVSPREMCVHDPAGMLQSCDICGIRPLSHGVYVES